MFHIILLILKMIGIILLVILGIVLFLPVRYQVEAESDGSKAGVTASARVFCLFRLISGVIRYENEKTEWKFRVFWKKLGVKEKPIAEQKVSEQKTSEKEVPETKPSEKQNTETLRSVRETEHVKTEQHEKKTDGDSGKIKQKKSVFAKIQHTYRTICAKITVFSKRKESVMEFLAEEIHQLAFSRALKELMRFVRFLRPKKLKADICFGFEDPCSTGQALAVLGMLYPYYGEHTNIVPDFEQKRLEGSFFVKGHLRGIYLMILLWNVFFDKNIRTTYQHIRTFKF